MNKNMIRITLLLLLGLAALLPAVAEQARAAPHPFPVYPSLDANVEFWKKVYTEYPSTRGYIHDNQDLSVIYEVIRLKDNKEPGARKINKQRIKAVKEKYSRILEALARGDEIEDSPEAVRVKSLWAGKGGAKRYAEAAGNIRFQHCLRDKFRDGLKRSGRYLDQIKTIIRQYGLPEDLAYLPHVESSFNYEAYSKFGAAGIWQFIRSTGRRFMTISYTLDERRDPILATHAAAQYLKENYEKLQSWPLALTAYNHGANGMMKAKKQHGDFEQVLKLYQSRRFGFASKNFYAEFLAAVEVAKDANSYFAGLRFDPPLRTHDITMESYYAIDELAKHLAIEVEEIRSLNPALRPPVYKGQKYIPKGATLRLPTRTQVIAKAAAIPPALAKTAQKRSRFYRVARGDTAGKIARMHKVSLKDLMISNNLDRRATIYVGQNLRIPGVVEERALKLASLQRLDSTKRRPQAEVETKVASTSAPEAKKVAKETPSKDDVPLSQAKKPLPAVAESPDRLHPLALMGNFQVEKVMEEKGRLLGVITVEAWETLGHYAEWLQTSANTIRRLNGLGSKRHLRTSQKIKVPLHAVSRELFEERRFEFHQEIEEDFFSAYRIVGTQTYRVKKGDNIWTLCQEELELPFWLVRKYNAAMDFKELRPDQVLVVPVVEKTG